MKSDERPLTLLVVDDEPINIRRVVECLGDAYRIIAAGSGERALELVERTRPDLILLDVSMPEMSGYEVCQRLKSNVRVKDVPVIFVTGISGQANEFEGLKHGAVDYITKPYHKEILQARVETHLALQQARMRLQEINRGLEELVEERTMELREAHDRLKSIDRAKEGFLNAISHELRTPVNGVLGLAQLALCDFAQRKHDPDIETSFNRSRDRLIRMIESAEFLVSLQIGDEVGGREVLDIETLLTSALDVAQEAYDVRHLGVECDIEQGEVLGNERTLRFALTPLIGVGMKFSTRGSTLRVKGQNWDQSYVIDLSFVSRSIEERSLENFFELGSKYRSASQVEELGLSIPVAYEAIRVLGGSTRIFAVDGQEGLYRITVRLPLEHLVASIAGSGYGWSDRSASGRSL